MNTTKNTIEIFDKYAKLYQEKYMNVDLYSESLIKFCKAIKTKNPDVLELACGPGNITKFLIKNFLKPTILEAVPIAIGT